MNIPNLNATTKAELASLDPATRTASYARSQIDITYHNLDLELGRAYYVSEALSFRPHWGVRTSWLDIESRVRYNGTPSCAGTSSGVGRGCADLNVNSDSDFWGIGPRAGMNSKWYLGSGISIFGNIAGGLLFGFFDVDHHESDAYDSSNDSNPLAIGDPAKQYVDLEADRHALIPTVQLFAGLRYDTYVNQNKQHIGVGLGYEINYWWRIDQSLKFNDTATTNYNRKSEDLAFYGITFNVRLDF